MVSNKLLFIAESATLAHVARSALLAHSFNMPNFEKVFACDTYYSFVLNALGITRTAIYSRPPVELEKIIKKGACLFDDQILRSYVKSELALLESIQPKVVVGDLRPSLSISCQILKIPLITISNAHWSEFARRNIFPIPPLSFLKTFKYLPFSDGIFNFLQNGFQSQLPQVLAQQAAGLDQVCQEFGVPKFDNYFQGFTNGDLTLFADTPRLAPTNKLTSRQQYLGVLSWSPKTALPQQWINFSKQNKLKVYVALGSSGDYSLLSAILKQLLAIDAAVLVSLAGNTCSGLPNSYAITYCDYVNGELAAADCDIVISNGGSPTSYQALSQGKPVIGICSNMDQLLTMQSLQSQGLGLLLRANMFKSQTIKAAIYRLIKDADLAKRLSQVQQEIASYNPAKIFNTAVRQLTGETKNEQLCAL